MCPAIPRALYGLAALILLAGRAFAQNPYAVGDPITNPFTGATETVDELLGDTMVLTNLDNAIRVSDIEVGDTFDDPDNPGTTLEVIAVRTNATTNLTDQVTVTDNADPPAIRMIDVVEPVDDSVPAEAAGAPGQPGGSVPVPIPTGNTKVFADKQEGADGGGGSDGYGVRICIIECFTIGRNASPGQAGGSGPPINHTINGPDIESISPGMPGVWVSSTGGNGGVGGDAAFAINIPAAQGGAAGAGGNVTVTSNVDIATSGDATASGLGSYGIFVQSRAGTGGAGGNGYVVNPGGGGGPPGTGGNVVATNNGTVTTFGDGAIGMLVQSLGGGGGAGGDSYGIVGSAGTASQGGNGGTATANNAGTITTSGAAAHGVLAESIGGEGGDGGAAGGIVALGATGNAGGAGGKASVTNEADASITTSGGGSFGIFAQSVGGGGGNGGNVGGLVSIGATGAGGGSGGEVSVTNRGEVTTSGSKSHAVLAQSVGGGGGAGSSGGGVFFTIGGSGGVGGNAGAVTATNEGSISTTGDDSHGLFAQSVGGGGGTGGSVGSVSAFAGVAIGGRGGDGGTGSTVTVNSCGDCASITTEGDRSKGILAQSVGGGGGDGGFAAQVTGGYGLGVSVAVGGAGGGGGIGGTVKVNGDSTIVTKGDDAEGILAQSVGGGGGNGGFAFSFAGAGGETGGAAISVGVGGKGGGGGQGGRVEMNAGGSITTEGNNSEGLIAQSVGGGGGTGGFSIAISAAGAGAVAGAVSVGVGGGGGGGGNGDTVDATYTGDVTTSGDDSHAVLIQSGGGGGGNGGFNVSGAVSGAGSGSVGVTVGVGGFGGDGGNGGEVIANITGDVTTSGDRSTALVAQSTGGGGGNGAFNVSGSITGSGGPSGAVSVGVGGSGGGGGIGRKVDAELIGDATTTGAESDAVLVQSVGGAGGNGAFNVSGAISLVSTGGGGISVGFGGSGGDGGDGGEVIAEVTGDIETSGIKSSGLIAQSLGGGGGNGAFNVSGALSASSGPSGAITVGVGGSGGGGGDGSTVTATLTGDVTTEADSSEGVLAQSVGGSGGNGAFNVSGGISLSTGAGGALSVGFGGSGGDGGDGGAVNAAITGDVATEGDASTAITAQSLGGSGGNGQFNVSGGLAVTSTGAATIGIGVGGAGGGGGSALGVTANVTGDTSTEGDDSRAILVQSAGGGGGNGAVNVTGNITASNTSGAGGLAIGVGGFGGGGGNGASANATIDGDATTQGDRADAVVLQSVGGGGGNGAVNVSGSISLAQRTAGAVSFGIGGFGGGGGDGSTVIGSVIGDVSTLGDSSIGVFAQSVGGAGGRGALNVSGAVGLSAETSIGAAIGIGGFGGGGGNAGAVTLTRNGDTTTDGINSHGVIAQSTGGGGGEGGINISGALTAAISGFGPDKVFTGTFGLGGFGGNGGDAKDVVATVNGDVRATGFDPDAVIPVLLEDGFVNLDRTGGSNGILAQSVGGSGGLGNLNVSGGIAIAFPDTDASARLSSLNIGVGGFGGGGGDAGAVTLTVDGDIVKSVGDGRVGVGAQSLGGGGGQGGFNVSGGIALDGQIVAGVGGFGGDGGLGRAVIADADTDIEAEGFGAIGFMAQSIGGGGGAGHINVSGGIQANTETSSPSLTFGLGGFGGAGNASGTVTATQEGDITVEGFDSIGVLVQSVAGGGGDGRLNVSGNGTLGKGYAAAIGIGGKGGLGADAGAVTLTSDGELTVDARAGVQDESSEARENVIFRERANGILVQSIGGGGGHGGVNVSGVLAPFGSPLAVGVGGFGGGGGDAGAVTVKRGTNDPSLLKTQGHHASALTVQSIGGGGGDAGLNLAIEGSGFNPNSGNKQVMLVIGGGGGDPGHGKTVDVTHTGNIETSGRSSDGILAQSIGGGGGNAAINIGFGVNRDAKGISLALGGAPGEGGNAEKVTVKHTGGITTGGTDSTAIFAQSIGGGGGNADISVVTNLASRGSLEVGIGRLGGTGGIGKDVEVNSTGNLETTGDRSVGIRAQSIGNGGGESGSFDIELSGATGPQGSGQSSSASLAVGLEGGAGGTSGRVDVDAKGRITTGGADAHAIHAQSVGGGGGVGGSATSLIISDTNSVGVGVGGQGGTGATSGVVDVDNDARLRTHGDGSHGIYAQSIGGAGGVGGFAGVLKLNPGAGGPNETRLSGTVSVGGKGGTGATGNTVDVTNTGSITTEGKKAFGVNAQSIGGGGGDGGAVINGSIAGGTRSGALTIDVGGKGNTGGVGALARVVNEGTIHTKGQEAVGIQARSVGGGGGDAGFVAELSIGSVSSGSNSISATLNVGGEGGSGNTGGEVSVTNRRGSDSRGGKIITEGKSAHGIVAESLGGGGGSGGSVISLNATRGQAESLLIGVNVGGHGGTGGTGGKVTVTNDATIDTAGAGAHGIVAKSIGGGGGSGGLVLATNLIFSAAGRGNTPLLVLGGAGGSGNGGGEVIVNNSGSIVTRGDRAQGIFAQSIGGGGGDAGIGLGVTSGVATTAIAGVLSVLLGGRGGDGGLGGPVTVNHSGDITVLGDNSQAVVAESLNGGGGRIALDFNGITSLPGGESVPGLPEGTETQPVFVFGGGNETQNSNAGRVTTNYTGTFGVAGDNGAGNSVRAIGGGGGTYDANLDIVDLTTAPEDRVQFKGRLGGLDGQNNAGGDIESRHAGDLVTLGTNTPGLFLQSIGGGGGRASIDVTSQTGTLGASAFTLGGDNGLNENGGRISHEQAGSISTSGDIAHGAILQSIGGGGGLLSLVVQGGTSSSSAAVSTDFTMKRTLSPAPVTLATLTLGSVCGTDLNGDAIDLELTGDVSTNGASSAGLILQSIGGGGGTASVLGADALDVTIGGSDEASGHGGMLTVTNTGDVWTTGARSHGVFLQSIGGGGGAVFTDTATPTVHLSSVNDGDGGAIRFTQIGDIVTRGSETYGLLAQSLGGGGGFVDGASAHSAGGIGSGGDITLLVAGDVVTTGDRSTGVFAQSTGRDGAGDIQLVLGGGHHIVGGANGAGVVFDGGVSNRFENHGSLMTMTGATGLAFQGGGGDDVISNHGVILGSVDLGGGENSITNHSDATLYSGTGVNLGAAASLLTQNGLHAPGAAELAVVTSLNGSLRQSAGARSEFDLDFATETTDAVIATGTVEVDGTLDVSLLNTHAAKPGSYSNVLYRGAQGLTDNGLTLNAQPSVVVAYDFRFPDARTATLGYDVDFAPSGLIGNRREIGEYVNRVQTAGGSAALDDTISALVAQTDFGDYSKLLTQLGAEFYAEQQVYTLDSVQRFARSMQDCGALNLGRIFGREGGCGWARFDVDSSTRDTDEQGFPGAEETTRRYSVGFQHTPESLWTFGMGVTFEDSDSDGFGGTWSGDARTAQLGFLGRRAFGRASAGAVVTLGNSSQDVRRSFSGTGQIYSSGQRDVTFASGVFDVTYHAQRNNFSVMPALHLGVTALSGESINESGIDTPDASLSGSSETHAWLEPSVAFGYETAIGNRKLLRAYARLGLLQYLTETESEVRAGFADAPAGVETMRIVSDLDETQFLAEGGLELLASDRFTFALSYATQDSELRDTGTGTLRFWFPLE